ncbi:MAG: hypothetical protein WC003_00430 [Terrimicrobiaceae bacterium]
MRGHAEQRPLPGSAARLLKRWFAGTSLLLFWISPADAQSPPNAAAASPATAEDIPSAPTDASQNGAGPSGEGGVKPPGTPNVLDGLESLRLAKDPDFGPPIIGAGDLYQGRANVGAAAGTGRDSLYMRPLEPTIDTPRIFAPSMQANLEAPPNAPDVKLPALEMPDTFGSPMTGLNLDTLGLPTPRRPLGTIGAPDFLKSKRSFVIGNSRVRYGVAVDAAVAYNNNVFGSPNNPQGDMILTFQPTFYLETGKKGTMQFLWSPSVLQYAKYKRLNAVNQAFLFSSRYRWSKLRVGLDASYLAQSGLFLNSQGQGQQKAVFTRIFAGYAFTKKTEALFGLDGVATSSNSGGSQFQATFNTSIDYKYSRKTTVGAGVVLGYNSSSAGTTTSESFLLRLLYNPTSKLVFRGEGGLQFRQSALSGGGSSSAVTSVVNLSLLYKASSKTYVTLRFFRNVDMDSFSAGTLQITTSLESTASWRVSRSTIVDLALAAGRVENVSLGGQNTGTFNFVQANLGLSYMLGDEVNLKLFNNLQQKLDDSQGNNYLSNTSGMALGLRF